MQTFSYRRLENKNEQNEQHRFDFINTRLGGRGGGFVLNLAAPICFLLRINCVYNIKQKAFNLWHRIRLIV